MPALFASYDPELRKEGDLFDIRTRLAISLIVSGLTIWLSGTAPLLALGLCTLIYVLFTGHWKVIVVTYLAVSLMMALSMGVIWVSFLIGEACVAGTAWEKSVAMLKPAMLGNFHTPFLRMIPSLNVLLAIGMNFSVQRFVGAMKSIRLPRVLFLPLMVFCRFVPEFVDVIRQLRDAVRMRGFAITFGSIFAHPIQTLRLTFIPLTVRTLRMADHLSVAAEMKRVGYARRPTQLRRLHFHTRDSIALIVTLLLTVGFIAWQKAVPATPYGPAAMKSMKSQDAGADASGNGEASVGSRTRKPEPAPHASAGRLTPNNSATEEKEAGGAPRTPLTTENVSDSAPISTDSVSAGSGVSPALQASPSASRQSAIGVERPALTRGAGGEEPLAAAPVEEGTP